MIDFFLGILALWNANFKRPGMVTGGLLAIFIGSHPAFSQRTVYHHNTMWARMFVSDRLSERLTGEFFFQYRTQNSQPGSLNIFRTHYVHSYTFLLQYTLPRDFKISVTPFCYFVNQRLGAQPGERPVREFRWVARAENQLKFSHFQLLNRLGLEYRWRNLSDEGVYVPNWRIRYMFRITKPIQAGWLTGKAFNLIAYDEVMVQFGKAVHTFPTLFDQNRVFVGASYEPVKNIRVELGYLYIRQQRSSREQFDDQNALVLTLRFDNAFSQFRKKAAN